MRSRNPAHADSGSILPAGVTVPHQQYCRSLLSEVLVFDGEAFVVGKVAVDEEFAVLRLVLELPVEPGANHTGIGTAVGLSVGAAVVSGRASTRLNRSLRIACLGVVG